MTIAGTHPEEGLRVALDIAGEPSEQQVRYAGYAFTPWARYAVELSIEVANGAATLHVGTVSAREDGQAPPSAVAPPSLDPSELAFIRQLGRQVWRLATQTPVDRGGGKWSRRLQRWRGKR